METEPHRLVEPHPCPMSSCLAPAGSPCSTTAGRVAGRYHTARFQLVPALRAQPAVPTPAVRHPGSLWRELPAASTRVRQRPQMAAALAAAREYRALGARVTLVVHEMKRLGRGALEVLKVAEELRDAGIELEFLTGPLAGRHDPAGHGAALFAFFAAMAESEREYIRDKTLEGQESARAKGKSIGGVTVSDEDMLATAVRLREQEHLSLREIAARLVIRTGSKRGRHPSPATVMRMLREHDQQQAAAA